MAVDAKGKWVGVEWNAIKVRSNKAGDPGTGPKVTGTAQTCGLDSLSAIIQHDTVHYVFMCCIKLHAYMNKPEVTHASKTHPVH